MVQKYYMARSVRDALEERCFYSFDELTDATNPEIADFLVANNIAIAAREPETTVKNTPVEQPVKRGRGRPRKDSYQTREMRVV